MEKDPSQKQVNVLTFDVEEWFHVLDNESTKTEAEWARYETRIYKNMDRIFNFLQRKDQKATFFCLGWIAQKYPDILKRIDALGYEIASHSAMHQLVYEQGPVAFKQDVEASIKSIEDVIGKKVTTYRAPGFSIKESNKWALEILIEQGITTDCSIFPAKRGHGGFESFGQASPCFIEVNGTKLKEFPINLFEVFPARFIFSGGGYFRLIPYWLIKRMMQRSDYVMTYFHPRDFDPTQPKIQELSLLRKFKSYYGLGTALNKLEKLLSDFSFIDLKTADKQVDWNTVKTVSVH